jgi:hypothetical protein
LTPAGTPIFMKQYGERRTGTNYLRALLMAEYCNAVPLMHVLGDKHSPPVALDELWQMVRDQPDAAWRLVTTATFCAPAASTRLDDPQQLAHMRALADPIAEAVASGSLVFVLSTKHPFPWVASLANFRGWLQSTRGGACINPRFVGRLIEACRTFNLRHQSWLNHLLRHSSRSAIVRHEDLLADPYLVLRALASRFELAQAAPELKSPPVKVLPTNWDQDPPGFGKRAFDPEFYKRRDYASHLNPDLWEIVARQFDWSLMSRFGYSADGSSRPREGVVLSGT